MKNTTKKDLDIYQVSLMHNYKEHVDYLAYIRGSAAACAFDNTRRYRDQGECHMFQVLARPAGTSLQYDVRWLRPSREVCTAIGQGHQDQWISVLAILASTILVG